MFTAHSESISSALQSPAVLAPGSAPECVTYNDPTPAPAVKPGKLGNFRAFVSRGSISLIRAADVPDVGPAPETVPNGRHHLWRVIMRKFWITLAVGLAGLASSASLRAAGPACAAPACAAPALTCAAPEPTCEALADACCDPCGRGCGLFSRWGNRGAGYEGLDSHFNCGCNGSYKFPVPPLYTYHWPGMYQQHLMTDYHSPWRFPPLKPYVDEVPPVEMGSLGGAADVQTASAVVEIGPRPVREMESMSSKMLRSR
jgi:hypothetical protein